MPILPRPGSAAWQRQRKSWLSSSAEGYIWSLLRERPDLTLTVILPEIVVRHWWHRLLHNGTTTRLRRALRPLPKVVVTTVPFHLPLLARS
jgi:hypothetical protein